MDEVKIGLLMIVLGIFLLIISEMIYEPEKVDVSNIDIDMYGDQILVKEKVSNIEISSDISFLHLSGSNSIDFVYFDEIKNVKKGDRIKIIGRVEKYQGEVQVVVSEIYKED